MKTRLFNFLEGVRKSFWLIPGLMVLCAIGLSFTMIALDKRADSDPFGAFGLVYNGGAEGARSILSTIAGSMITVAGVVFSITIVALTLASSQFGPRLFRNFMKDKGNQVVLGTFIATFIYCLVVLRTVNGTPEHLFVPGIAITFAMALALVNVCVLIYFIHHVSISIHADQVIADVYTELSEHIQRLFPNEIGDKEKNNPHEKEKSETTKHSYHQTLNITALQSGYIQAVDDTSLLRLSIENDLLIHIRYRPGEFIVAGNRLSKVESNEPLNEDLAGQITRAFIVGAQRTPEQDVEFAIHQLVEVALHALSPGLNDPFTAIICIDYLGSALCCLTNKIFPTCNQYDDEGKLRLITTPLTFEGVTNAAFDQIRQCGRTNVAVIIRLLETLETIAGHVRNSEQALAIFRQADMIARSSQTSLPEKNDREDTQIRYQAVLDALDNKYYQIISLKYEPKTKEA